MVLRGVMPCCGVLRRDILWCVVYCHFVLSYAVLLLCCDVLCCVEVNYVVSCCVVLYCIVL